mmetsp:Transcript_723/g.2982  ORF Transcript_723/g.2982 Transcript_723/m.2982 type:complete len:201 (-) Transcript_723:300-902(-)
MKQGPLTAEGGVNRTRFVTPPISGVSAIPASGPSLRLLFMEVEPTSWGSVSSGGSTTSSSVSSTRPETLRLGQGVDDKANRRRSSFAHDLCAYPLVRERSRGCPWVVKPQMRQVLSTLGGAGVSGSGSSGSFAGMMGSGSTGDGAVHAMISSHSRCVAAICMSSSSSSSPYGFSPSPSPSISSRSAALAATAAIDFLRRL